MKNCNVKINDNKNIEGNLFPLIAPQKRCYMAPVWKNDSPRIKSFAPPPPNLKRVPTPMPVTNRNLAEAGAEMRFSRYLLFVSGTDGSCIKISADDQQNGSINFAVEQHNDTVRYCKVERQTGNNYIRLATPRN